MAAKKFSAVAGSGAIAGTDTILGVQSGTTDVQYTVSDLLAYIIAHLGAASGTSLTLTAGLTVDSSVAIPAGGNNGDGIKLSTTANFGIFFGSGAPSLSAAQGSLYIRSDGTTVNDRAYINSNGTTGWTALTTVG